jgi:hypothetical protein
MGGGRGGGWVDGQTQQHALDCHMVETVACLSARNRLANVW